LRGNETKNFWYCFPLDGPREKVDPCAKCFSRGEVLAGRYKNFMHKKSGILTYLTYLQTLHRNFEEVVVKDGWG
jgi:hypothetical protein